VRGVNVNSAGGAVVGLKQFWKETEAREVALTVFTGLVVAYVRQGLQHHWKLWGSIGDFLAGWFIHTMGVAILMAAALAAIIYSHSFFWGTTRKNTAAS
jgi:hypothetical protein